MSHSINGDTQKLSTSLRRPVLKHFGGIDMSGARVTLVAARTWASVPSQRRQDAPPFGNQRRAVTSRQKSPPLMADLWLYSKPKTNPNQVHHCIPSSHST